MKKLYYFFTPYVLFILSAFNSNALMGQVGINTTDPDTNSVLDIVSTTKGMLIPRLNQSQVNTLAGELPTNGLLIYNTDSECLQIYQKTSPTSGTFDCLVRSMNADVSKDAWINDFSNSRIFLNTKSDGTTLRTPGTEVIINDNDGKVGIGTTVPANQLHVKAAADPLRLEGLENGDGSEKIISVDANGVIKINVFSMKKITADYSVTSTDETILVDATNNDVVVDLPATAVTGTRVYIKRLDVTIGKTVTVNGSIDNNSNVVLPILNCYVFQYYLPDNKWYLISRF